MGEHAKFTAVNYKGVDIPAVTKGAIVSMVFESDMEESNALRLAFEAGKHQAEHIDALEAEVEALRSEVLELKTERRAVMSRAMAMDLALWDIDIDIESTITTDVYDGLGGPIQDLFGRIEDIRVNATKCKKWHTYIEAIERQTPPDAAGEQEDPNDRTL